MDHVLGPMMNRDEDAGGKVSVYMDDTGSFAKDNPEAVTMNREILERF